MKVRSVIDKNSDALDWILLLSLSLIWGFSFFFIKKGLIAFSPLQVGSLRIFISFLAFVPFLFLGKYKVPRNRVPHIILMALMGSGIPPFLFALAQMKIDSAVTGILNSTTPVFALCFGSLLFGTTLRRVHVYGVLLGLAGAVSIVLIRFNGTFEFNFGYALLIILATSFYGLNANLIKRYGQDIHPLNIAVFAFTSIGPFAGIYLWHSGFLEVMAEHPHAWKSLGHMLVLGILGTAYSLVLFNYLTQRTSALFSTMVTYLIPIVAVILGLLDGEQLGLVHLLGMISILTGVYLTSKFRK